MNLSTLEKELIGLKPALKPATERLQDAKEAGVLAKSVRNSAERKEAATASKPKKRSTAHGKGVSPAATKTRRRTQGDEEESEEEDDGDEGEEEDEDEEPMEVGIPRLTMLCHAAPCYTSP